MDLKVDPKQGYELVPDVYFFNIYLPFRTNTFYRCLKLALTVNAINQILDVYIWYSSNLPAIAYLEHGIVPMWVAYESVYMIILLNVKKKLMPILDIINALQWPLNNIRKTTKNIILTQALTVRVAFYITCFIMFIDTCCMWPEIFNMPIIQYLMDHVPISVTICVILPYTIHIFLMALCVVQLSFILIYLSYKWTIQIDLLHEFSSHISKENENLFIQRDKRYQTRITKGLRKIAIRQNELVARHLELTRIFATSPLACIIAPILHTSFIIFATIKGFLPKRILIMHFLTYTWLCTYVAYTGQFHENKWSTFYKLLCSIPWCDFNIANRKTYLLILTGSAKDIGLVVFNSLCINCVLFLKLNKDLPMYFPNYSPDRPKLDFQKMTNIKKRPYDNIPRFLLYSSIFVFFRKTTETNEEMNWKYVWNTLYACANALVNLNRKN